MGIYSRFEGLINGLKLNEPVLSSVSEILSGCALCLRQNVSTVLRKLKLL